MNTQPTTRSNHFVTPKPYKGTNCSTAFGLLEARNPSKWAGEPYEKNPINPEGLTCRSEYGLSVRSKSESIIASQLERYNIPFRYEALLQLEDQIYYPDFTILNPQDNWVIYWEHFGMVDDPEYARQMDNKLAEYRKRDLQGKTSLQHMKQEHTAKRSKCSQDNQSLSAAR